MWFARLKDLQTKSTPIVRLLPLSIFFVCFVITLKAVRVPYRISYSTAEAQDNAAASTPPALAPQNNEKPEAQGDKKTSENQSDAVKKSEPKSTESKPAEAPLTDKKDDSTSPPKSAESPPAAPDAKSSEPKSFDINNLSLEEFETLLKLNKARNSLIQLDSNSKQKELALKAAIEKLEQQIALLQDENAKRAKAEAAVTSRNKQNLDVLVKIYEKMKPKTTAEIWEQMDLPLVIELARHMKDAKLTAILSVMTPESATNLTQHLARKEQSPILTDANATPAKANNAATP